jgi:Mg2+ and Co2+ transporter CorA
MSQFIPITRAKRVEAFRVLKSQSKEIRMREMKDIQAEYSQQAMIAGQTQYQIKVLQSDLEKMNAKLSELNDEARAAQAAQPPPEEKKEEVANGDQA